MTGSQSTDAASSSAQGGRKPLTRSFSAYFPAAIKGPRGGWQPPRSPKRSCLQRDHRNSPRTRVRRPRAPRRHFLLVRLEVSLGPPSELRASLAGARKTRGYLRRQRRRELRWRAPIGTGRNAPAAWLRTFCVRRSAGR